MEVHRVRQEAVAHNLANAQTPGFKRVQVSESLFAANLDQARAALPQADAVSDLRQGALRQTDRPLDFALEGAGFFVVAAPDGPRYARAGNLSRDPEGRLVTRNGWRVQGAQGEVNLGQGPVNEVRTAGDQSLSLPGGGQVQLKIVDFPPGALSPAGDGTFRALPGVEPSPSSASLRQGALELGNASPVEELVELIDIQRSFEAASRSIATIFRVEERLTNELR